MKLTTKKLLRQYETAADIPLLRASLQLIPHIGGALDVLIFDRAAKIKEKRLVDAIEGLKEDLSKISKDSIDNNYTESEEFLWLVEKVFTSISSEVKEQKREFLRTLLANSCKVDTENSDKEILYHIVDSTPTYYLVLLNIIKTTFSNRTINFVLLKKAGYTGNVRSDLHYLASAGLLDTYTDVSVDTEYDSDSATSVDQFKLNKLGDSLLNFISK